MGKAKTVLIGHIGCPCCGAEDAAVKEGANGMLNVWCDCGYQSFARRDKAKAAIREKMTPVASAEPVAETPAPEKEAKPAEKPAQNPVTEKKPEKPADKPRKKTGLVEEADGDWY